MAEKTESKRKADRVYSMGFTPKIVDKKYLDELNVAVKPSDETLRELQRGSSVFANRYGSRSLIAKPSCAVKKIAADEPLKAHRYTSKCPIDILEIDPAVGCEVNCLYCLVTDGNHSAPKVVYKNYADYLKRILDQERGYHYYYFAPKSEPFQESTLSTGIAHDILRAFKAFFNKNPESKSRVSIISKAGKKELQYKNNGDTILDLMRELSAWLIYDASITVMPPELYPIMEPRAASNEDRLEAANICQSCGIQADRVLVQPIIPSYLNDRTMDDLLKKLKKANIKRFKPEFLTVSIDNLAWIGQLIGHFDKSMEKSLYELYIAPANINNVKHRTRMAPDRQFAHQAYLKLKDRADNYGIGMSVCNWIRDELDITDSEVSLIMREAKIGDKLIGVCKPVFWG